MANNIQVSFAAILTTSTDYFVAALYDASNLGVCLESQQIPKSGGIYPAPPAPMQVTFLTSVTIGKTYRVILWESVDATPTGVSKSSGDITVLVNGVNTRSPLYLVAGTSAGMTVGATEYVDPTSSLAGWSYVYFELGSGPLTPGAGMDYTVDPTTGNPTLINGETFQAGQKFVIMFLPQVGQAISPPVSAIQSGTRITASITLTAAQKNMKLYIQGAGTNLTVVLPLLSDLADYDCVSINSDGGTHINAIFPAQGTDKIQYKGQQISQLILAQGENLLLIKANGVYNVDNSPLVGWDRVGETVWKWAKGDSGLLLLNGQQVPAADYARLYAYISGGGVDAAAIVSQTTWNTGILNIDNVTYATNKGKWVLGGSYLQLPVIMNSFIRNADGTTRYSGSFQADAMLDHQHSQLIGLIPGAPNGEGPTASDNGRYNGEQNQPSDLTGHPYNPTIAGVTGTPVGRIASEVRPPNIALYAAIRF